LKGFILIILLLPGVSAVFGNSAFAATYYVRIDGGDATQCSGEADASVSSPSAQGCAFSHPRYALGWGCTNAGNNCTNAGVMKQGDTLYISGDDPADGGQAQYEIGYDDTENNLTPGCSSASAYDCTMGNLPAGLSSQQRTSIIGTGKHKPQLWGTQRVWQVLNAVNDHIWLQNLEITDHAGCAYNSPDKGCSYDGPSFGPWAEDGLYIGGDDVNVTDVYVHGLGRYGVNTDNLGNATFTRLNVIGNGYAGFTTGINATVSGGLTFDQPVIEWNGCVEAYPLTTSDPADSPSNFSDCFGQNQGGYGDGLAFGNVGHGGAGNWTIYGPGSISFNTQDGLDTLHGTGTGTIQIDKMRFEGNAGNQVKMNALTSSLTNSIVIGDCGWWSGAPQSSPGFAGGDICRALGDAVLFNVTNNSQTHLYNNTIVSNGNVAVESEDLNATGCNGSTSIDVKNNIIVGGHVWIDDTAWNASGGNSLTSFLYNDGSNGDGAGTCGPLHWNEDYNIVNGTRNNNRGCSGPHDNCGADPGFTGSIPMGKAGGRSDTFYQGNSGEGLVSLNERSSARASGLGGLSYWNNGNDYYNETRANPPSRGALEPGSHSSLSSKPKDSGNNVIVPKVKASKPEIIITNPVNGSVFKAGSDVEIIAAAESSTKIAKVSFYYNGMNLLGSVSTLPYEYVAEKVEAGQYIITALVTDSNGVSTASLPIKISVINSPSSSHSK
jgi:hypothetical protein